MYNSSPFGPLNGTTTTSSSQSTSSQQQNSFNANIQAKPFQTLNNNSAFIGINSSQKQQSYNETNQQNKRSNVGLNKRVGSGINNNSLKTSSFSNSQSSLLNTHSSPFKGSQLSQSTSQEIPFNSPFPPSIVSPSMPSLPSGNLTGHLSRQMPSQHPNLHPFSISNIDHHSAQRRHSGFQGEGEVSGSVATGQGGLMSQTGFGFLEGSIGEPVGSFGGGFNNDKYSNNRISDRINNDEYLDEPPLLEELGINPEHILKRIRSVLLFYKLDQDLLIDCDMCGPVTIAACLGCCLLLSGKAHFGHIYSLSITGCVSMYVLLNLMSQKETLDLYRTTSILGYGLMPIVILSMIAVFVSLRNSWGAALSVLCVWWCTATASRFFETALQMYSQRYLIAYPIALLYACFVLITVF